MFFPSRSSIAHPLQGLPGGLLFRFLFRAPAAAAYVVVLAVTVATVTFCSWRTANENPADCVKTE
jgi:hypothetical protein